jgi:GntR family transcriptional regulator
MRDLRIDPSDAIPIWKQIEDGLRRLVASAAVEPGSAIPSVREMAKSLRVNPATVAKAYQRLTDAGVLSVRRGEGTFVADAPPAMRVAERDREISAAAARYVAVARTLGTRRDDAVAGVERAWDRWPQGAGSGGRR